MSPRANASDEYVPQERVLRNGARQEADRLEPKGGKHAGHKPGGTISSSDGTRGSEPTAQPPIRRGPNRPPKPAK